MNHLILTTPSYRVRHLGSELPIIDPERNRQSAIVPPRNIRAKTQTTAPCEYSERNTKGWKMACGEDDSGSSSISSRSGGDSEQNSGKESGWWVKMEPKNREWKSSYNQTSFEKCIKCCLKFKYLFSWGSFLFCHSYHFCGLCVEFFFTLFVCPLCCFLYSLLTCLCPRPTLSIFSPLAFNKQFRLGNLRNAFSEQQL